MVKNTGEENDVGVRGKYDMDGLLGLLLIFLGFAIVVTYGRFFIMLGHRTLLFVNLSILSTFARVLIVTYRDKHPDLSEVHIFVCLITRILNYMIVTVAGYSVSHRIAKFMFSTKIGEFSELGGLNLVILAFNAVLPYLIQKTIVEKIFKKKI